MIPNFTEYIPEIFTKNYKNYNSLKRKPDISMLMLLNTVGNGLIIIVHNIISQVGPDL